MSPYILARLRYLFDLNPVKLVSFSILFVRIPPESSPGGAGDLTDRRGVRFGAGFVQIAPALTPPLFQDKMAAPRGDYDEQGEYLSSNEALFVMIREECFTPVVRGFLCAL